MDTFEREREYLETTTALFFPQCPNLSTLLACHVDRSKRNWSLKYAPNLYYRWDRLIHMPITRYCTSWYLTKNLERGSMNKTLPKEATKWTILLCKNIGRAWWAHIQTSLFGLQGVRSRHGVHKRTYRPWIIAKAHSPKSQVKAFAHGKAFFKYISFTLIILWPL